MNDTASWVAEVVAEVARTLGDRSRWPRATYRLQFHKGRFGFREAAAIVPYLSRLGVSHLYASPWSKNSKATPHGYAIVDYSSLDEELGDQAAFDALVEALAAHQMAQILDIVPNHMSTAPGENAWWTDVLQNGPSSPYADFFDIDWRPVKEELRNRVLLPILGRQFGEALEAGELRLRYHDGAFFVDYFEKRFPLDPGTYGMVLAHRLDALKAKLSPDNADRRELESILTAVHHLPRRTETQPERVTERQREKEVIRERLRRLTLGSPEIAAFLEANVAEFNGRPEESASFDLLDKLLDAQAYRLSHWKAASDEINYRRFFDINDLAAVCTEEAAVFQASHTFVLDLLAEGKVAGLRIDHVDGLFDPLEYLWRLQWGFIGARARRLWQGLIEKCASPAGGGGAQPPDEEPPAWSQVAPAVLGELWPRIGGPPPSQLFDLRGPPIPFATQAAAAGDASQAPVPLYVVVEKILGPEEPLPREWPVAGTTGYDFANSVGGLFVDPAGWHDLEKLYWRFTREPVTSFAEEAHRAKLAILRVSMSSELQLLAYRLNRISERHRLSRDFTLNTLRIALREILACFPVYRTYVRPDGPSDRDREIIRRAVALARRRNPDMDAAVFDFIRGVLLFEQPPKLDKAGIRERQFFVGRFQQVTSPVVAKGVEDTAFYRYHPLASMNEVGGDPGRHIVSVERFHQENARRHADHPWSLIATSTHDTKRSQDVRARISVLSEIPRRWFRSVNRWARLNRRHRRDVEGEAAPSRNDEYLFYQTLVGVWPLQPAGPEEHEHLVERVAAYMEKATREAKLRTSWVSPNPGYDEAVQSFVRAALTDRPRNRFLSDFRRIHEQVVDAGLYTALSQLFSKLTSPGVPDVYQGQELWDFSLVDPDNRRPVDFDSRAKLLAQMEEEAAAGPAARLALARRLGASPRDPRLKLLVTWCGLQFRRQFHDLVRCGRYVPLAVEGNRSAHLCAFAWHGESATEPGTSALVVAPRLLMRLAEEGGSAFVPPLGRDVWQETRLLLPDFVRGRFEDRLTGRPLAIDQPFVLVADILSDFPLALLTSQSP